MGVLEISLLLRCHLVRSVLVPFYRSLSCDFEVRVALLVLFSLLGRVPGTRTFPKRSEHSYGTTQFGNCNCPKHCLKVERIDHKRALRYHCVTARGDEPLHIAPYVKIRNTKCWRD